MAMGRRSLLAMTLLASSTYLSRTQSTSLTPVCPHDLRFYLFSSIAPRHADEFGSFDPTLGAFIPTALLGSTSNTTSNANGGTGVGGNGGVGTNGTSGTGANGTSSFSSTCVTGYDQVSFVMGLTSNFFNTLNNTVRIHVAQKNYTLSSGHQGTLNSSIVGPLFSQLNGSLSQSSFSLSNGYVPNPFQGVAQGTYLDSNSTYLTLADGGEDGEEVPFQPLLVQARGVDVIVASDGVSDQYLH